MDGVIAVGVAGMDGITVAAHNPGGADMGYCGQICHADETGAACNRRYQRYGRIWREPDSKPKLMDSDSFCKQKLLFGRCCEPIRHFRKRTPNSQKIFGSVPKRFITTINCFEENRIFINNERIQHGNRRTKKKNLFRMMSMMIAGMAKFLYELFGDTALLPWTKCARNYWKLWKIRWALRSPVRIPKMCSRSSEAISIIISMCCLFIYSCSWICCGKARPKHNRQWTWDS